MSEEESINGEEKQSSSTEKYNFRTVVKALITNRGDILIGKKEEKDGHPISGKWHILGGHLEHGEQVENAVEREVKEETGLDVKTHQVIDVMTFTWKKGEKDSLQIVFHCEAERRKEKPQDDLTKLKWVSPEEITDYVHTEEAKRLENRKDQAKFLEKLEKMPSF